MADEKTTADAVQAVTGRSNDTPVREPEDAPLGGNSTFASRAAARSDKKAIQGDGTENKAVSRASTKRPR